TEASIIAAMKANALRYHGERQSLPQQSEASRRNQLTGPVKRIAIYSGPLTGVSWSSPNSPTKGRRRKQVPPWLHFVGHHAKQPTLEDTKRKYLRQLDTEIGHLDNCWD